MQLIQVRFAAVSSVEQRPVFPQKGFHIHVNQGFNLLVEVGRDLGEVGQRVGQTALDLLGQLGKLPNLQEFIASVHLVFKLFQVGLEQIQNSFQLTQFLACAGGCLKLGFHINWLSDWSKLQLVCFYGYSFFFPYNAHRPGTARKEYEALITQISPK
jgi:hypothetical protein